MEFLCYKLARIACLISASIGAPILVAVTYFSKTGSILARLSFGGAAAGFEIYCTLAAFYMLSERMCLKILSSSFLVAFSSLFLYSSDEIISFTTAFDESFFAVFSFK